MNTSIFHAGKVVLHAGDCLDVLDTLYENSIDSCVVDPPYHLASIVHRFGADGAVPAQHGTDGAFARAGRGFMGKQWDGGDIAFRPETWAKVLRVLKPGGYILAFSSSRTFGRMSVAIEDAGFITHPMIGWITGQGMPKATRVKAPGYEGQRYGAQSLKPVLEPIYMGQKPFSEKNGTANILRWGTGAVNIDGCRIEIANNERTRIDTRSGSDDGLRDIYGQGVGKREVGERFKSHAAGRWPANVITDGSDEVVAAFPDRHVNTPSKRVSPRQANNVYGSFAGERHNHSFDSDGSAARFFYAAKASKADRAGSKHPTIKPLDLMQYLVRLVTPKGGLVLDPFAGSGTTGHAALLEGMRAVLIEREPEYQADIARRMELVFASKAQRKRARACEHGGAGPLFREAAE